MNIKRQFEEYCMIKLGHKYDASIFKKAYAKAEKYAQEEYGEQGMDAFKNELGLIGINYFYLAVTNNNSNDL